MSDDRRVQILPTTEMTNDTLFEAMKNGTPVTFQTDRGPVKVSIMLVAKEDGSGTSWIFEGDEVAVGTVPVVAEMPKGLPVGHKVHGYVKTTRRGGFIAKGWRMLGQS